MPKPAKGPYVYKRKGRSGWWGYVSKHQRHIPLHTEDKEEANRNLWKAVNSRQPEGVTESDLRELFLTYAQRLSVKHSKKVSYDYSLKIEHIASWFEEHKIDRIEQIDLAAIEKFKAEEHKRGLKNASINRYLDRFKALIKLAVQDGKLPRDALYYVEKLPEAQVQPHQRGLIMAEINAFLASVEDRRDWCLFRTVVGSGIRDDEARHLQESSIQKNAIVIKSLEPGTCACHPRGWTTKNYRCRTIPVSDEVENAAREFVAAKEGMILNAKSVWTRLQVARGLAGIKWKWSMHDLRRAWGSHMLAAGFKLSEISRWYGHGDIKTTMRYLRVVEDEMPDPSRLPL